MRPTCDGQSAPFALARNAEDYPDAAETRFSFQLAEKLGMTVGELMGRMSVLEFRAWQGYYSVLGREQERAAKKASKR